MRDEPDNRSFWRNGRGQPSAAAIIGIVIAVMTVVEAPVGYMLSWAAGKQSDIVNLQARVIELEQWREMRSAADIELLKKIDAISNQLAGLSATLDVMKLGRRKDR